ncbi:MAG TPA: lipoyl(octanoyl) transferase LipB [Bryobacteraceae bacterium]|nr:lipoyl(octanoyl) transferase LipB [Bryobacteraceae bacterium]
MLRCAIRDVGPINFEEAYALQQELVSARKQGLIPDQLLFLEHPHVITMGRNGRSENLLATPEMLAQAGVAFHHTDRGGDVTYHGPGQVVAYPIFDLKDWKRDVVAYVRGLEQVVIGTLSDFGIEGSRVEGCTGVWVEGRKVCAIGVHLSRWVTSHGLALNVNTNLEYFRYIIPCGLTKPVTSMTALGSVATRDEVVARLAAHFIRVFDLEIQYDSDTQAKSVPLETIA